MGILFTDNYAFANVPAVLNSVTNALTISAWVKRTVSQSLDMVCSRQTSATANNEWWALTLQGGQPRALIGDASSVTNVLGPTALILNRLYHLAMTFNGSTINLFVDGVQVATGTRALTFSSDTTGLILSGNANGANNTNINEFFGGILEDIRIYNRVLSNAELSTIVACAGDDLILDNLLVRYLGNDPNMQAGALLRDIGPNSCHATLSGGSSVAPFLKYGRTH